MAIPVLAPIADMVIGPECEGCVNQRFGKRLVPPEGNGSSGMMFVGDSPWFSEIAAGRPFAGASGWFLDNKILQRLGIDRKTLTITNSIWCRPPHLGWTDQPHMFPEVYSALRQCSPYLDQVIAERKPRVLVALGSVALRRLCDITAPIESRHSYVHETSYGIPCVASFHPSHIMQGKHKLTPSLLFTVRRAQEIASGTYRPSVYNLILDPSPEAAAGYLDNYLRDHGGIIDMLMVDIETPESIKLDEEDVEEAGASYNIERAGFALDDKSAISFPYCQPYISILQKAINHSRMVSEWADNHFDFKRLRANGVTVPETTQVISGMWAWHWLQSDLLKGLAFVAPFFYAGPPFKQMASVNPSFYNAMDNAVGRACTLGSMEGLKKEGRLDSFMRHCVEADAIFVRMGSAGAVIDQPQRAAFMGRLKEEYKATITRLNEEVPLTIRPVEMRKIGPTKDPETWTAIDGVAEKSDDWKGMMEALESVKDKLPPKEYKEQRQAINDIRNPYRWRRVEDFNPNSTDQVKDLIRSLGLKVPTKRGGAEGESETSEAKHLRRFAKKHRVFHTILLCRQRVKMISTYNWPLREDGRVITTYGWHPSTLRKSSRNVNLQNIPKRSELADEFRRMIIAAPGHYLLESDASAIEAVLVGYDAGSERYVRLAKAGLHGWMTSAYHGEIIPLTLPDKELAKLCKAAKKKWPADYEVLKRVGHLSNYGGTPERIYEEYPEEFESVAAAKRLQDFYFSTEPGSDVKKWQQAKMLEAHKNRFLLNHFGYKHYFYGVFKWDAKKQCDVMDDDAKRAVAFIPQADASAIQTEVILRLAQVPEMLEWLRLIIHDSIVLEVPEDQVEYAATNLHWQMIQPIKELSGLTIGAETKFGRNLGSYHAESNKDGMQEMIVEEGA